MIKLLLYCTKAKPYLWQERDENNNKLNNFLTSNIFGKKDNFLNGNIVAECECDKVEVFTIDYRGDKSQNKRIEKDSCLDLGDLIDYQKENHFLYALHLSNLKIFDEPKELNEYLIFDGNNTNLNNLKPNQYAPQNMKNVYEFCSDNNILLPKRTLEKCILISIQPQHLANILNGKKTIEIRKRILNCLKELIKE